MGSDAQADVHIAGDMIFGDARERPPVRDHVRHARPGDPPEPGAQWNELSGQWEGWDDGTQTWVVVGGAGPGVDTFWDDDEADEQTSPSEASC
jgi:hypothetical protein